MSSLMSMDFNDHKDLFLEYFRDVEFQERHQRRRDRQHPHRQRGVRWRRLALDHRKPLRQERLGLRPRMKRVAKLGRFPHPYLTGWRLLMRFARPRFDAEGHSLKRTRPRHRYRAPGVQRVVHLRR